MMLNTQLVAWGAIPQYSSSRILKEICCSLQGTERTGLNFISARQERQGLPVPIRLGQTSSAAWKQLSLGVGGIGPLGRSLDVPLSRQVMILAKDQILHTPPGGPVL